MDCSCRRKISVTETRVGDLDADWVTMPNSANGRVVLYLHGGGYVMGSRRTHRELVSRIAREAAARVLVLEYRLAPEHPFPAAVEDATAAYRWLRKQGIAAGSIAIAGDSAGGGLTLATLAGAARRGRCVAGVRGVPVAMDRSRRHRCVGATRRRGRSDDFGRGASRHGQALCRDAHCAIRSRRRCTATTKGLPPLLIQVGTREILLDDSTRVADKARAAGVPVRLEIEEGAPHVWQATPHLPEAADAVRRIGAFVRERIPA